MAMAVMAGIGFALRGGPAQACGACVDDLASPAPSFRREPLPSNARVLVAGRGLDAGAIAVSGAVDGGTVVVPFTTEAGQDAFGSAFVSLQWPSAHDGRVTITSNLGASTYDIGARPDLVAPQSPDVSARSAGQGGACCRHTAVSLSATGGLDDDGTPAAALRVRLSSRAGSRGVLLAYRPGVEEAIGTSVGGCLDNDPLAQVGEAVEVTVTALDWAGNESPPRGPFALTFVATDPGGCPGPGPMGCSAAPQALGICGSLAVLAGLGLRRRAAAKRARWG